MMSKMDFQRTLLWLNCGLFVVFGLGFIFAPAPLSTLITGAAPATSSGLIDLRATYGGMGLGLGFIFGFLAKKAELARLGAHSILVVMVSLAGARLLGMGLDGAPNFFMLVLLGAELGMAGVAVLALRGVARENS